MKTAEKAQTQHPILQHLQTHPALNLSYFARELGLDPSNFKKMVSGKLKIKEEVLRELGELLEPYGYGGLKWWDIKEVDMELEVNWRLEYLAKDEEGLILRGYYSNIDGKVLIEDGQCGITPTHIIPIKNLLSLKPFNPKSKEGLKCWCVKKDKVEVLEFANDPDTMEVDTVLGINGSSGMVGKIILHKNSIMIENDDDIFRPTHIITLTSLLNLPTK